MTPRLPPPFVINCFDGDDAPLPKEDLFWISVPPMLEPSVGFDDDIRVEPFVVLLPMMSSDVFVLAMGRSELLLSIISAYYGSKNDFSVVKLPYAASEDFDFWTCSFVGSYYGFYFSGRFLKLNRPSA